MKKVKFFSCWRVARATGDGKEANSVGVKKGHDSFYDGVLVDLET